MQLHATCYSGQFLPIIHETFNANNEMLVANFH